MIGSMMPHPFDYGEELQLHGDNQCQEITSGVQDKPPALASEVFVQGVVCRVVCAHARRLCIRINAIESCAENSEKYCLV